MADWTREVTMDDNSFNYTIYIDTTPKKLWNALTKPTKTTRWWHLSYVTDWKSGSAIVVKQGAITIKDPEQVVLESTPHSRLSYTWHTFSPEWAQANGFDEETRLKFASETRSKVTFEIARTDHVVRLTVLHDGFDDASNVLDAIRQGWPSLLSSLKTYLETGEPLNFST
jgi:uncharacterized protein YndB with AHSA1/START domain